MRLTISGHSFEVLSLEGVLSLCKHLGFKGVDISGFHARGRCSIEPEDILLISGDEVSAIVESVIRRDQPHLPHAA